jgi:pimeloyl-ACP methyl ester carboxylesterase
METLLPGITAERMPTSRLTVALLSVADRTGPAVLFVHGNVSSSLFWQPTMLALPEPYRPLAIDLRGFGGTDPEPVDATAGCGTTRTTWPPPSRRSVWTRCTWSAGAWAAA